jgi:hypothetical protein
MINNEHTRAIDINSKTISYGIFNKTLSTFVFQLPENMKKSTFGSGQKNCT